MGTEADLRATACGIVGDLCIDVKWPWSEIQDVLSKSAGCSCDKPLIMSQSGHTPFGSTYFYAFPGLAFEVMQNGFLASLTVFSVPHEELPSVFLPRALQPAGTGADGPIRLPGGVQKRR